MNYLNDLLVRGLYPKFIRNLEACVLDDSDREKLIRIIFKSSHPYKALAAVLQNSQNYTVGSSIMRMVINFDRIDFLIGLIADGHAVLKDTALTLQHTASYGHQKILVLLFELGANPAKTFLELSDNSYLVRSIIKDRHETLYYLAGQGFDIEGDQLDDLVPMLVHENRLRSSARRDCNLACFLLARMNITDHFDKTGILALKLRNMELFKALLEVSEVRPHLLRMRHVIRALLDGHEAALVGRLEHVKIKKRINPENPHLALKKTIRSLRDEIKALVEQARENPDLIEPFTEDELQHIFDPSQNSFWETFKLLLFWAFDREQLKWICLVTI